MSHIHPKGTIKIAPHGGSDVNDPNTLEHASSRKGKTPARHDDTEWSKLETTRTKESSRSHHTVICSLLTPAVGQTVTSIWNTQGRRIEGQTYALMFGSNESTKSKHTHTPTDTAHPKGYTHRKSQSMTRTMKQLAALTRIVVTKS